MRLFFQIRRIVWGKGRLGDFAFNNRSRYRQRTTAEYFVGHDFAGNRIARTLGFGDKAIAIDMKQKYPATIFGGHIGHRHRWQLQRFLEERDRINQPTRGVIRQFHQHIRIKRITAPRRDCDGDMLAVTRAYGQPRRAVA